MTAEYAIAATRSALELIGGNGYTSHYPVARLLRGAQVLTGWEGPANIQALELLRLLLPRYGGWNQYHARVQGVLDRLPDGLGNLGDALALLCEAAGDAHGRGNGLPKHSAWRFY